MKTSYHPFALLSSTCPRWILGRRLKGAGHTRNGEEEQPLAPWGLGERGERAGKRDVILASGSAAARAQSED